MCQYHNVLITCFPIIFKIMKYELTLFFCKYTISHASPVFWPHKVILVLGFKARIFGVIFYSTTGWIRSKFNPSATYSMLLQRLVGDPMLVVCVLCYIAALMYLILFLSFGKNELKVFTGLEWDIEWKIPLTSQIVKAFFVCLCSCNVLVRFWYGNVPLLKYSAIFCKRLHRLGIFSPLCLSCCSHPGLEPRLSQYFHLWI